MGEEKEEKRDFSCYTYSECETGGGQLVKFTCHSEDVEKIKQFLSENVRTVDIPTTGRVNIPLGGYGRYTRYDIEQYKYAGGGGGYIEALEIKNPPDKRCGNVVHHYNGRLGSVFFEFKTIQNAESAFENCWASGHKINEKLTKQDGFLRKAECGAFTPWFYAVGSQLLVGDSVFPDFIIEDDPIFKIGRQFIIRDFEGMPTIKTCLGMRKFKTDTSGLYGEKKIREYKEVFWNDGTTWNEYSSSSSRSPTLLPESQLWIQEAINKFRELLTGKTNRFEIEFIDGDKFIGRFMPKNKRSHHKEGEYKVKITYRDKNNKKRTLEGKFYFIPTPELPTLEDNLRSQTEEKGGRLISIDEVVRTWYERGGHQKWAGVYPASKRD